MHKCWLAPVLNLNQIVLLTITKFCCREIGALIAWWRFIARSQTILSPCPYFDIRHGTTLVIEAVGCLKILASYSWDTWILANSHPQYSLPLFFCPKRCTIGADNISQAYSCQGANIDKSAARFSSQWVKGNKHTIVQGTRQKKNTVWNLKSEKLNRIY